MPRTQARHPGHFPTTASVALSSAAAGGAMTAALHDVETALKSMVLSPTDPSLQTSAIVKVA